MVITPLIEQGSFRVDFPAMNEEEFFVFCQNNRNIRIEREPNGSILLMSPVGNIGSRYEMVLAACLEVWSNQDKSGFAFSPSVGFTLPDKSVRSPDASWVLRERWLSLPQADRRRFAHIVPDFVAEIRSESDSLPLLMAKMDEYLACGVRRAWLIDPLERRATIYRPDQAPESVGFDATLSGEAVLPGFTFPLSALTAELDA